MKQYKRILASCSGLSNIVAKFVLQECKILFSAKLQISEVFITKNKSYINIANNRGMYLRAIPCLISDLIPLDKGTFVFYLREIRSLINNPLTNSVKNIGLKFSN